MSNRLIALIGLSILVVLAGCNGATAPQSPTSTSPSESPQQNDKQPGAVFNGVQLPNGTTATSINETQVLATHQSVLTRKDYRIGINLTHATPGRITNTTTVIASNRSSNQLYFRSDLPGRTLQKYYTANQSLTRTVIENNSSVRVSNIDSFESIHERKARPGELLTTLLRVANFTAVNTTTVDGRDAIIYNITNISESNTTRIPSIIEQFNGSMTIGERGIIWEATLLTVGIRSGTIEVMVQEYRTLEYGTVDVKEPAWVQNRTEK